MRPSEKIKLLCFAWRDDERGAAVAVERLHASTTNYDRLIEHGCDFAGLRIIDRFVGALNPVFRASRVEVDIHYNPPGIRGEPRFMEGVVRLSELSYHLAAMDLSSDLPLHERPFVQVRLTREGLSSGFRDEVDRIAELSGAHH